MNEFTNLVKAMRTAQKEYFKTKHFSALDKSRRLEREVDAALQKLENPELF